MDRRQKKTREAIFSAFTELLSKKHYNKITVGEIIESADVGRATFYAHFETKDFLLKELCEELFCHIFDATRADGQKHTHIFECDAKGSVFPHLIQHLEKNDHNILSLLVCENNELFLKFFKQNLRELIKAELHTLEKRKPTALPDSYFINHISATFVESIRWWIENGMKETPEELANYFMMAI